MTEPAMAKPRAVSLISSSSSLSRLEVSSVGAMVGGDVMTTSVVGVPTSGLSKVTVVLLVMVEDPPSTLRVTNDSAVAGSS
jgi:hypothetical protein